MNLYGLARQFLPVFVGAGLVATSCYGQPQEDVSCFEIDGEEVCGSQGETAIVQFAIKAEDAESGDYVLRIHPEDAELYHLREQIVVEPDVSSSWSKATIQRLSPGPAEVCLRHNVYLQSVLDRRQTVVFDAGECTTLFGVWSEAEAVWVSY